jgi:hypothetical protein
LFHQAKKISHRNSRFFGSSRQAELAAALTDDSQCIIVRSLTVELWGGWRFVREFSRRRRTDLDYFGAWKAL